MRDENSGGRLALRVRVVAVWATLVAILVVAALFVGPLGPRANLVAGSWPVILGLTGLILLMAALAAILLIRRPGNRIGLVFTGLATVLGISNLADTHAKVSFGPSVEPLPGALVLAWINTWGPAVLWWLVAMLLLLFPTGRLPSQRWRPVAWAATGVYALMAAAGMFGSARLADAGPVNPGAIPALQPFLRSIADLIWLASTVALAVCAASLIARYRSADGIGRHQLKWLAMSGLFVGAGGLVMMIGGVAGGSNDELTTVAGVLFGGGLISVPIFATLAILRYRLYAIDRIVSRTLSYALVTAVLGGLYGVVVFALSAVVASGGGGSEVAVAGATLAAAAAFHPVRRRVQHVVNRRFNRARYDAERTVQGFAERLRDRVDVDDVKGDLLHTAVGVVQPARAQLWLRPDP